MSAAHPRFMDWSLVTRLTACCLWRRLNRYTNVGFFDLNLQFLGTAAAANDATTPSLIWKHGNVYILSFSEWHSIPNHLAHATPPNYNHITHGLPKRRARALYDLRTPRRHATRSDLAPVRARERKSARRRRQFRRAWRLRRGQVAPVYIYQAAVRAHVHRYLDKWFCARCKKAYI